MDCGAPLTCAARELHPPEPRCDSCSQLAATRERRKRTRTGLILFGVGITLLALVGLMARAGINPGEQRSTHGLDGDVGLVGILGFAGFACLVVGLTYMPRLRRRLKL
jgi:hypothetical protein